MRKNKIASCACLLLLSISLSCIGYPFYLTFSSSDSYLFNNYRDTGSAKFSDQYKVHFGIDTLMTNGIRTRLDLTNQDVQLFSQVVIDQAVVDYSFNNIGIQLAIKDFGYGKGFLLYNRRSDNSLNNKNCLIEYRWKGISSDISIYNHQFGAGIGSNSINNNLAELSYRYHNDYVNAALFGVCALHDSQYNTVVNHTGTEISTRINQCKLHTAFSFQYYPDSQFYPVMNSWHLINELGIDITSWSRLILSSDHKTIPFDKRKEYLVEACLNLKKSKVNGYLGVNQRTVYKDKVQTFFTDINWNLIDNLSIGLFYDYSLYQDNHPIMKFGLQTSYNWGKTHE